jgi:MFS family permease
VPSAPLPYFKLIGSLWTMSLTTPVLRRRAACHAGILGSFSLGAEVRSRLNGIYFALFFAGAAAGSALGGWVFANHGWHAGLALLYRLGEYAGHVTARGKTA